MDIEADIPQRPTLESEKKFLEGSRMTKSEEKSEVESDEKKHVYYSPTSTNQWSTNKPVNKQSSGVCVYTYKVNSLDFHPYFSFSLSIFFHYDRKILVSKKISYI